MGKLLLLAASLGCLGPCLTIAACLSHRSPFAGGFDQQDAVQRAKAALAAPGPLFSQYFLSTIMCPLVLI